MLQDTLKDGGVLSCQFESFSSLFSIRSLSGPLKILKQCSHAACSLQFSLASVESSSLPFATNAVPILARWVRCDKDTDVLGILKLEHVPHLVRTSVCGDSRFEHDLETWFTSCKLPMPHGMTIVDDSGKILAGSPVIASHVSEPCWQ